MHNNKQLFQLKRLARLVIGKLILTSKSSKIGTGNVISLPTICHWEILKFSMHLLSLTLLPKLKEYPFHFTWILVPEDNLPSLASKEPTFNSRKKYYLQKKSFFKHCFSSVQAEKDDDSRICFNNPIKCTFYKHR